MKALIVAREKGGKYAPFITEQAKALENNGVNIEFLGLTEKGLAGYTHEWLKFKKFIGGYKPDVIHAHYGLCGVLSNLQRTIPVVTTYHGSDINNSKILPFSKWSIKKSAFNIFVSQKNIDIAKPKKEYALIPCGINLDDYPVIGKREAREIMGLKEDGRYVLFAGAFDNMIKNAPLAKAAVSALHNVELLELNGYSRMQVAILMQAVDSMVMTSYSEGSPQVIKEALACGCPIVSVDVGDVKDQTKGIRGCFISERSPDAIANYLNKAFQFGKRTNGRERIIENGLTNDIIASKITDIYHSLTQ